MNPSFLLNLELIKTLNTTRKGIPSVPRSQILCTSWASFTSFQSLRRTKSRVRARSSLATESGDRLYQSADNQAFPGNLAADNPPAFDVKVGVLLLNLGGPETLDDVQPFLYNLFADPDIIRLPAPLQFLQPAIAQLVSVARAPKSREGYEAIGGGSPLRRITEEQASALKESLNRKGVAAKTYVAMRYWKPFTGTFCMYKMCIMVNVTSRTGRSGLINYVLSCPNCSFAVQRRRYLK